MALRRLQKELSQGGGPRSWTISCGPAGCDLFKWKGLIEGPDNTPYEGGYYELDIQVPQDYPFKPPKVKFTTKMYHCNINDQGRISLDVLRDKWSPSYEIYKVLGLIRSLLENPNTDDPIVPEIAYLYKTNKILHDVKANQYAHKHAGATIQMSTIEYRMEQMKRYKVIQTCLIDIFGINEDIQMVIIAMDGAHIDKLPKLTQKELENNMSMWGSLDESEYIRKEFNKLKTEPPGEISIKSVMLPSKVFKIGCWLDETVKDIKLRIMFQEGYGKAHECRLISGGKVLPDNQTLSQCKITYDSQIYLVVKLRG
eukprot:70757_1